MLYFIWTVLCTLIGYGVGALFFPDAVILCTIIGFVFGLVSGSSSSGVGNVLDFDFFDVND